ncbi:hypothetical protein [Massilia sp. YMA4]|uniref:DUF2782 domain-containing protein n=1 Tax=[Empedobacter] haloabium TaxID=592317 RepID=A0ABZ1UNA7_9BURK|nr:hypothetical protein [Massilia sp. YMA4]AXA92409.1 hypothetical protein DPH57_15405 [Massilia sp. YMA4]
MRAPALLLAVSALYAIVFPAFAQTEAQKKLEQPPKLEQLDDTDTPITVSPKQNRETTTSVQRQNGRITQETVHAGGSTYTIKPNNTNSTAQAGDAGGPAIRGAQWTVMEFDIAKKQKQRSADAAAAAENAEDAPPPPPPPAKGSR